MAKRVEVEARAASMIEKAKTQVMLQQPLWAALLMRLRVRADWRVKTMCTDAVVLAYNPEFVCSRTLDDLVFIFVHEVVHCALGHPMRSRGRDDPEAWGQAVDHAANHIIKRDARMTLPPDGLCDPQYEGLNADVIYRAICAAKKAEEDAAREEAAKKAKEQQERSDSKEKGSDQGGDDSSDDQGGDDEAGKEGGEASEQEGESDAAADDASGEAEPGDGGDEPGDAQGDAGDAQAQQSDAEGSGNAEAEAQSDEGTLGSGTSHGDVLPPGALALPGDVEQGEDDEEGEEEEGGGDRQAPEAGDAEESRDRNGGPEGDPEVPEGIEEGDEASDAALEREWQEALSAAAMAAGDEAGAFAERLVREGASPRQSFAEVLERFLVQRVQEHDDWGKRNRRFDHIYMPSRGGIGMSKALFGIDTSMSITDAMIGQFQDVVQRIWTEAHLAGAIVAYCDTEVRRVDEYDQEPSFDKAPGGGGTHFAPVFKLARERIEQGEDIACVIYLTDQENYDKSYVHAFDDIPTLWVNPGIAEEPPFGEVCSMLE